MCGTRKKCISTYIYTHMKSTVCTHTTMRTHTHKHALYKCTHAMLYCRCTVRTFIQRRSPTHNCMFVEVFLETPLLSGLFIYKQHLEFSMSLHSYRCPYNPFRVLGRPKHLPSHSSQASLKFVEFEPSADKGLS